MLVNGAAIQYGNKNATSMEAGTPSDELYVKGRQCEYKYIIELIFEDRRHKFWNDKTQYCQLTMELFWYHYKSLTIFLNQTK